jgi:hypothetical protein
VKFSIVRIAIPLLLIVLGAAANAMGAERAFKAEVSGFVAGDFRPFGVGQATHFGAVRMDIYLDENFLSNHELEASVTFYSRDGDFLFARTEGPGPIDPVTGIAVVTFHFIGGGGRFEGATGSIEAVFTFTEDAPVIYYDVTFDGSVDY